MASHLDKAIATQHSDTATSTCSWKKPRMPPAFSSIRVPARRRILPALLLAGMLISQVTVATTTVTRYTYDAGDHITTVTDPRGLITAYNIDGLGLVWGVSSPDTGTTTYSYDAYGRRSSLTRANGATTTYGYDAINRPTSVSAGGQAQTFAYDNCLHGLGRLCTASDATSSTAYAYTPEGRISQRGFSISGTGYALSYAYDAMGQLTAITYPDGHQALYNYTNGAVSSIAFVMGSTQLTAVSGVSWQPMDSALASWTSSNGLTNTLSYDTDGRLAAINTPGAESLGFTYDTANRLTGIANTLDSTMSQNFGYDDQSRLVAMSSASVTANYGYDADGNRIGKVVNGTADNTGYSATSNHLVSTIGADPQSYGYDALGNVTTLGGATAYQYDAFNRMSAAGGTSYAVSPEGQRLRKSGGAGTTYFAPDASGTLLAEYLNGGWIDYVWLGGRLIGREVNGQLEAIGDDQLGRPQVVTNASQAVVWSAQNWPFTRSVAVSSSAPLNLGFPGQYYDQETGLWNNGFRDYDPALGRYVESDPTGLRGGVNTYAYADSNPISEIDPYGLYCLKEWEIRGVAGAVTGAFAGGIAGSESGPGAALSALGGAVINGGLGVLDGLTDTTQINGAASGVMGAMLTSENKGELGTGMTGALLGGPVAAQMINNGYPRPVANATGAGVGGGVGGVIYGFLKGSGFRGMLKVGLKGGGIGVAISVAQSGLEAALRAGNNCGCGK